MDENNYITHKIRCFPNKTQIKKIKQTLGLCRWIYNAYLDYNQTSIYLGRGYVDWMEFSLLVTQWKKDPDSRFHKLKEVSQKAVKESFIDACRAYCDYKSGLKGEPKFKSLKKNPVRSYYLYPITEKHVKHNKIKLPKLGWVKIRENDYVPKEHIVDARLIETTLGEYYITLSVEMIPEKREVLSSPIGIDLGIKLYCVVAHGRNDDDIDKYNSFLSDAYLIKLEKKKKYLEQIISKKVDVNYHRALNKFMDENKGETPNENQKKKMEGGSYNSYNIHKVRKKILRINKKISDYKTDKLKKLVNHLTKSKPEYIAIEDLSVSNMISRTREGHSTSLSKHIQDSKFYYFKTHLAFKCKQRNIELRIADKYFASSKTCSCCGWKNKDLHLEDRIYYCQECGLEIDRDVNAAINLLYMKKKNYHIN